MGPTRKITKTTSLIAKLVAYEIRWFENYSNECAIVFSVAADADPSIRFNFPTNPMSKDTTEKGS
jgi:hypothetical protein